VIRNLPENIPLFVPDIPGYGKSTPSKTVHDKGTVGKAILDALSSLLQIIPNKAPRRIILAGHDRGARISHRLSVDAREFSDRVTIVGTILMDIVPTVIQWRGMANPVEAAGFFHWPFLANVELATSFILKIGGDVFIRSLCQRWLGDVTQARRRSLLQDGAQEAYDAYFKKESVIRAACLDYEAGATVDVDRQKDDQERGRKIEVPTLVLHCAGIGRRFPITDTWKEWIADGKDLSVVEIGEGAGHSFPEEAPEATTKAMLEWIDKHNFI
jgi:pimeloyl-ACP methyl ester carboxylesterase